jgi:hypothetical protein
LQIPGVNEKGTWKIISVKVIIERTQKKTNIQRKWKEVNYDD